MRTGVSILGSELIGKLSKSSRFWCVQLPSWVLCGAGTEPHAPLRCLLPPASRNIGRRCWRARIFHILRAGRVQSHNLCFKPCLHLYPNSYWKDHKRCRTVTMKADTTFNTDLTPMQIPTCNTKKRENSSLPSTARADLLCLDRLVPSGHCLRCTCILCSCCILSCDVVWRCVWQDSGPA